MKKPWLLFFMALLAFPCCAQTGDTCTYIHEASGWKIKVPAAWGEFSGENLKTNSPPPELAVHYDSLRVFFKKRLPVAQVAFQKNRFNSLQFFYEENLENDKKKQDENFEKLKKAVYNINKTLESDCSETTTEKIDGITFRKFHITHYTPYGDMRWVDVYYVGIFNRNIYFYRITHSGGCDEEELLAVWRGSKFRKTVPKAKKKK